MKSPPSALQSASRGHQKLVLEPLFMHGSGGAKLLSHGYKFSFLFEARDKSSSNHGNVRCTMDLGGYTLHKFSKARKTQHNNTIIQSRLRVTSKRPSSASISPGDEEEEQVEDDDELSYFKGLVLDFSYRPINIVCWKRAICLEFLEKLIGTRNLKSQLYFLSSCISIVFESPWLPCSQVDVLEYYDQTVSSPGGAFYIPAVLRVEHLMHDPKRRKVKVQLSRKNILGRDLFTCQYCGSKNNLTVDHVLPVCRGGNWNWENLVTACSDCNSRKGHKTLEEANMKLIRIPKAPKDFFLPPVSVTRSGFKMLKKREMIPSEWINYVPTTFLRP